RTPPETGGGQPGPDERDHARPGPVRQPATPTPAERTSGQWACVSGLDGLGAGHAGGEPQSLDRTGASARPPRPGRIGEPQESAHSHHPAGDHNPGGGAGAALTASGDKSSIQATSIRSDSITTVPPADPPSDPSASAPPLAAHA